MNSRERLLKTIEGKSPDRLPVTTHHVMPYFLDKYLEGISYHEFFEKFDLDPINWVISFKPSNANEYYDPQQKELDFLEQSRIISDQWRIKVEKSHKSNFDVYKYYFITPKGTLEMKIKANDVSSMVTEYLIKEKRDIDLLGEFMTMPICNIEKVNNIANEFGDEGIIRGHIPTFDVFGQPGCWQDAACLVGIEDLIMATYEDPKWVHELLTILQKRKLNYVYSMENAKFDIIELGGGHASTTIISPNIFKEFVAPYDSKIISAAHEVNQKIVYHICGGMMPILENISSMNPDAVETFTPPEMGGDVDLAEAKKRIGDKVCMIGGFNQNKYLNNCSPEETRQEVRKCFNEAGRNGGYILAPSDHFFDAKIELLKAFSDEARKCKY